MFLFLAAEGQMHPALTFLISFLMLAAMVILVAIYSQKEGAEQRGRLGTAKVIYSFPLTAPSQRLTVVGSVPEGFDASSVICSERACDGSVIVGAAAYIGRKRWPEHLHYVGVGDTWIGSFPKQLPEWAMEKGTPLFGFIWTRREGLIDLNWLIDDYYLSIIRVLSMSDTGTVVAEAIDHNMQQQLVQIQLPPSLLG